MTAFGCDRFRDTAPDLALGLLAGDERGAAISHVVTCTQCRRHLNGLVQVADDLLLLAPSVEPDIGFESRVMARLAAEGAFAQPVTAGRPTSTSALAPPTTPTTPTTPTIPTTPPTPSATTTTVAHDPPPPAPTTAPPLPITVASGDAGTRPSPSRGRRWARPIPIAIAAALIVVAGITGWASGLSRGRDAGRSRALADQTRMADNLAARTVVVWSDHGQSWCQLVAFPGHAGEPARFVIHLDEPGQPPGAYQVLAEPVGGGPAVPLGTIALIDGRGLLTASVPPGTGPVNAVTVVEGPGTVKYRARFAAV